MAELPRVGVGLHLLAYPLARAGGLGTYERMLATALPAAAADRAELVYFTGPDAELPDVGVRTVWSRLPLAARSIRIPYELLGLPLAMRREHVEVFHFCDQSTSLVVPGAASVVTVHDVAMFLLPETFGQRRATYKRAATRRALRTASRVIAVSGTTRDQVVELFGVDPARVSVVHLGVDDRFRSVGADAVREARRQIGLPDAYLLYVGRLEPRKNLPTLLRAYGEARRRHGVTAPLVLAGASSWLSDDLPAAASQAGVTEDVRMLGHVPDALLPGLVTGARALVYPSRYEGFGLPVLEAMAAGTPVLASTAPALVEVAGGAALLVDPDDVDGLADGVAAVTDDEDVRAQLVQAGRARAGQFTWHATAFATVDVYEQAAALR